MKAYLKRINFSAELPEDFSVLKYIKRSHGNYLFNEHIGNGRVGLVDWNGKSDKEYFTIDKSINRILFSGSFSSCWLIRTFQKLKEWLFPIIYIIEYE